MCFLWSGEEKIVWHLAVCCCDNRGEWAVRTEFSNNNIMLSGKERLTSMQGHVVRECSWKVKLSLVMMSCRQWFWRGKVVGDYSLAYCWNSGASPVGESSLSLLSSRNRHRQYYFVLTFDYYWDYSSDHSHFNRSKCFSRLEI